MTPRHRGRLASAFVALALLLFAGGAAALPISGFVISEVMYESVGGDNGSQWVELYNGTGGTIDLSSYELQWGRTDLADSIVLSGSLAPGATWVIGGPTSDASNGSPVYDQVFNFAPNLADGGHPNQEDGLALVESATSTLLHIVVYGGNGAGVPYVDEQGNPAVAIDDSALAPGQSLEYLGTGAWQVQPTPTAGVPDPGIVAVPEPTPLLLLGLGLAALGARRSPMLDDAPARTIERAGPTT